MLDEIRSLAASGCKNITLLGQNVNSYGKDLDNPMDFAALLRAANEIPGDFLLHFMTSHPKDASQELFETMARCEKVAPVFHLPFQAGSSRVLDAMNRRYTREGYLEKVRALRALIPDVVLTSDVIVGFPGETAAEFEETLSLIEEVRFDARRTNARPHEPGGEAPEFSAAGGGAGPDFGGEARGVYRAHGALSGGRRGREGPYRPDAGEPAGSFQRGRGPDRAVCARADHRGQ